MKEVTELEFLTKVWGDVLEVNQDLRLLLWTPKSETGKPWSGFYTSLEEAAIAAEELKEENDVYFGHGLRGKELDGQRILRGKEDQVRGITGFVVDLDFKEEQRSKEGLFPSQEAAMSFLMEVGKESRPHSMVMQTGHGLHAYWLFHEPWVFEGKEEWEEARRLSLGWHRYVDSLTEYYLDPARTLDRVWRVGNTYNHKYDPLRLVVEVDYDSFNRHSPTDFEVWRAALDDKEKAKATVNIGSFNLKMTMNPEIPLKVLKRIAGNREFCDLWYEKTRRQKDRTASGWDMTVANAIEDLGLTNQEITETLIARRKQHGEDLKLRDDYYARTLAKLRNRDLAEFTEEIGDDERSSVMSAFSNAVGMTVVEIHRYGATEDRSDVRFFAATGNGKVILVGNPRDFMDQRVWREIRVANSTEMTDIDVLTKATWQRLIDSVSRFVIDKSTIEDTPVLQTAHAVEEYLVSEAAPEMGDKVFADFGMHTRANKPFIKSGTVFIQRDHLASWCADHKRFAGERSMILQRIKAVGFKRQTIPSTGPDGSQTTKSYWVISMAELQSLSNYHAEKEEAHGDEDSSRESSAA